MPALRGSSTVSIKFSGRSIRMRFEEVAGILNAVAVGADIVSLPITGSMPRSGIKLSYSLRPQPLLGNA